MEVEAEEGRKINKRNLFSDWCDDGVGARSVDDGREGELSATNI